MKILGRIRFYLQYVCVGFSACLVFMIWLILFSSSNATAISTHSLSLSTNTPTLESTINNTADEEVNIQKHEITINTNNPNGAKLFLSSKDNKTTPSYVTSSGPATGSGSTGTSTITESTGTISAPTKLSPNSFGFALDKNSSAIAANFSINTTYESMDNTDKLTAKFAKIPNMHNMAEIHNISTTATNNKLKVYYGTNTNSLMREGKYEMEFLYTIVSGTGSGMLAENDNNSVEIEPKQLSNNDGGEIIKIKTNIKSNVPLSPSDIDLYIQDKKCIDVNIIQNFELGSFSKTLEFTCKTPAYANGKYDVFLQIDKLRTALAKAGAVEYDSVKKMQDFSYQDCNGLGEGQVVELMDKRNRKVYKISKMKDGRCWMIENLALSLDKNKALTPSDTDIPQNWTPSHSTELAQSQENWKIGSDSYVEARSKRKDDAVIYNYNAATAQTTEASPYETDAAGSICPRGWKLPTGGKTGEYYGLAAANDCPVQYDCSQPLQECRRGCYVNHFMDEYHIGTQENFSNAYTFRPSIYQNSFYTKDKRDGYYVRCISQKPKNIGDLKYMQDMTPEHCANSSEHQTATLKDKRDNNTYTIAKLKDGKCWMTQNLRLKLDTSTPLKPTDSDVSSNWTPTRSTDTASCQSGTRWDQDSEGAKTVRSCYQSESTYNTNGVYYTHTAATAGTAANMNKNGDEATSSICPKGWRLPKPGTIAKSINNDFYNMAQHYIGSMSWYGSSESGYWQNGTNNLLSSPQNFVYSGWRWYEANGVEYVGSYGLWWSSTVRSSNRAYSLYVYSGHVNPMDYYYRRNGFAVRCIAR